MSYLYGVSLTFSCSMPFCGHSVHLSQNACNARTAGRRVKWGELFYSGVVVACIWGCHSVRGNFGVIWCKWPELEHRWP